MPEICTRHELEGLYPPPSNRAAAKVLRELDGHCRQFIALSPFLVLATRSPAGVVDLSPRGGMPGFVAVLDSQTLLMPDRLGNNRIDSLRNILNSSDAGVMFFIPGVDELLRVRGLATIHTPEILQGLSSEDGPAPRSVIRVRVCEAFLQCARALMRSRLWSPEAIIPRTALPTMGEMLKDHTQSSDPAESQQAMVDRYREQL